MSNFYVQDIKISLDAEASLEGGLYEVHSLHPLPLLVPAVRPASTIWSS